LTHMTQRLYYEDAYHTRFHATVVERFRYEDRLAIVLDSTYFYPSSGGQPADTGTLDGRPVVDVFLRSDGSIVHLVDGELYDDKVTGELDWLRRFDHMQQHTGQHILSQAFIRIAEAETVSFHLSDNNVTIDLAREQLEPRQIEAAEFLANTIVWENRPVMVCFVSTAEAERRQLRKLPPVQGDTIRLIDIESYDLTACGGTHVARTGEIGMIKIVRLERQRGHLRLGFFCGRRALLDYRQKNSIVTQLTSGLTTGADQVIASVTDLQDEVQAQRRLLRQHENKLLDYEAAALVSEAPSTDGLRIVRRAFTDRDPVQLRALANRIVTRSRTVALLGTGGERSHVILARAVDASGHMAQLLNQILALLGDARGGGSATLAQGGGPPAPEAKVERLLAQAEKLLRSQRPS
jgi:alanyl-tRNA synthetase